MSSTHYSSFSEINLSKSFRLILVLFFLGVDFILPKVLFAYEFAHYMIDARTGKFLYGINYEKELHPASLTKMMTLYLAFNELKKNRMNLDDLVTISQNASLEPSSKLWLSPGQRVSIRTLIRGAAIRSANDAATALGEHIAGTEAKFADYMTLAAREMGMSKTVFRNAHGLTSSKHRSTPKDMAILARRLVFDFPEYYNLFGRISVRVLGKDLYNTNRRFLAAYSGSDGIKTGFTSAAGYNLAASASRGNARIIAVIFGAGSVPLRNKRMTELLDLGFSRVPKVASYIPMFSLNLRPDMINQIGKNSLLKFSKIPIRRPGDLISPIKASDDDAKQKEEILEGIESSLMQLAKQNSEVIEGSIPVIFNNSFNSPPSRPKILMGDKEVKYLENNTSTIDTEKIKILVGFYYNKYNAEKDLPSILLSDPSLLDNVTLEISEEVFRNKKGFRIRISPLSELNAQRACAKIRAVGELCEISR